LRKTEKFIGKLTCSIHFPCFISNWMWHPLSVREEECTLSNNFFCYSPIDLATGRHASLFDLFKKRKSKKKNDPKSAGPSPNDREPLL